MTTTDSDPTIPDDLAAALYRAAAAVPEADLHPRGPLLRHRARRRRLRTFAASGAAAAVLVAGLLVYQIAASPDDVRAGDPADAGRTTSSTPTEPAPSTVEVDEPLLMPQVWAELLPGGRVHQLPKAQPDDSPWSAIRLADGRLVTLAARDLQPDVEVQRDGPWAGDVAMVLAVFDVNDNLLAEQDIRRRGETVELAGEHDGKVVLQRRRTAPDGSVGTSGVDLSLLDPTTFEETHLATVPAWTTGSAMADVAAGRLVLTGQRGMTGGIAADSCPVWVVDMDTAALQEFQLENGCLSTSASAVSPDGRYAAIVTDESWDEPQQGSAAWLRVMDLDTGQVVTSQRLHWGSCPQNGTCLRGEHRGLTWTGNDTVVAVVQDIAPAADRDGELESGVLDPQRLRTVTLTLD